MKVRAGAPEAEEVALWAAAVMVAAAMEVVILEAEAREVVLRAAVAMEVEETEVALMEVAAMAVAAMAEVVLGEVATEEVALVAVVVVGVSKEVAKVADRCQIWERGCPRDPRTPLSRCSTDRTLSAARPQHTLRARAWPPRRRTCWRRR